MVLLLAPSGSSQSHFTPSYPQEVLSAYLKAQAETGPASLSTNPDSSTVAQFKPSDAGAASGATNTADYYAKRGGKSYEFKMAAPLGRVYYLNVSSRVTGTIYFSATQMASGQDPENLRLRVEVRVGDKILAAGDQAFDAYIVTPRVTGGFASWSFSLPMESHRIEASEVLSVRVTRFQGFADFSIGTHGAAQSLVRIPYFDRDPMASTFYLDNHVLTPVGPSEEPTGPVALLVVGLGLSLVAVRPPRGRLLILLMLLAGALAGCTGAPAAPGGATSGSPTGDSGQVETGTRDDPNLLKEGIGRLEGIVRDGERGGVPLKGVLVAVLGTNRFNYTASDGTYGFHNMTPGPYRLRFTHDGFDGLESDVSVSAGKVAYLNVTLLLPGKTVERPSFDRPHVHDGWGGETRKQVQAFDVVPVKDKTAPQLGWYCDDNQSPDNCAYELPIDVRNPILPGTTLIEIKVNWDPSPATAPMDRSLRAYAPWKDPSNINGPNDKPYVYGARPPGTSYRIAIYPYDADPGHQNFTNWHFQIASPTYNWPYNPSQRLITLGSLHVEMWIEKGVIPLEPKHRDFWGENKTVGLLQEKPVTANCVYDQPQPTVSWKLEKDPGVWVPPGTKEVRGWFNWSASNYPQAPAWTLMLKGANFPKGDSHAAWFRGVDESSRSGTSMSFVIRPASHETDKYYQTQSYWVFAPSDGRAPGPFILGNYWQANCLQYAETMTFKLTAYAIKDPAYREA